METLYGSQELKNTCAAENFAKMALKSAIFELQKSFRHKFLSTINFLKNETGKKKFRPQKGGGERPPLFGVRKHFY